MLKGAFNFRKRGVCDFVLWQGLPDQIVTAGYCITIVQYYCPVYRKAMYWYFRWRTWRLENGLIYQHCFEYLHWWKGRIHILIGLKGGWLTFSFSLFHSVCFIQFALLIFVRRKEKMFHCRKKVPTCIVMLVESKKLYCVLYWQKIVLYLLCTT